MVLPNVPPVLGRCPSCHAPGAVGEACVERVCKMRGYCCVPVTGGVFDPGFIESDPLIGQRCGDYLLVSMIGTGGFGRIYKALQLPIGRPVAVKMLPTDGGPTGAATLKHSSFEVEVQALARLSHPNIVRLYQCGEHRGTPFLAMELIEGAKNLRGEIDTRVVEGRPFTLDEVEQILLQVLAGLEAAHEQQIVHRDIKPDNIMLELVRGHGMFVRVLDFGQAKFLEERTATSTLLGTPAYMAYEQLTRGVVGPWTDLYAVGVLAYELIAGKRPYGGVGVQEMLARKMDRHYDPWAPLADQGYPSELHTFVKNALAMDSIDRYSNVAAMRVGLQHAMEALRRNGETYARVPERPVELAGPIPPPPAGPATRRTGRPGRGSDTAPSSDNVEAIRLQGFGGPATAPTARPASSESRQSVMADAFGSPAREGRDAAAIAMDFYAPQPLQSDVVSSVRTARSSERSGGRVLARTRSTGKRVNSPSVLLHEALQEAGGPFAPALEGADNARGATLDVAPAREVRVPEAVGTAVVRAEPTPRSAKRLPSTPVGPVAPVEGVGALRPKWWSGGRVLAATAFIVALVTVAPPVRTPDAGLLPVEPLITERPSPAPAFTAAVPLANDVVSVIGAAALVSLPAEAGAPEGLWTSGVTVTGGATKTNNEARVGVRPKVEHPVVDAPLAGLRRAMLVTVPEGANVQVDGVAVGQSPITLEWREGTTSIVQVTLTGHDPAGFELNDRKNAKVLKLELVPNAWNRTF